MKPYGILTYALLFLTIQDCLSQTNVGGTMTSNTEWTLSGSPYNLTSTVGVAAGVTLTIQPGVQVQGSFDLLVKGNIIVNGSESQRVVFSNTRLMFKSSDLATSTVEYAFFQSAGIQLADETEFNNDNPKNSNKLLVVRSIFSNGSYARTKGYQSTATLRLEECQLTNTTVQGFYPRSEPIELVRATISNSTIISDSYNYGVIIDKSSITQTEFIMGCCDANFSISDTEITASSFTQGGGSSINGPIVLKRVTLENTYVDLPSAKLVAEECNIRGTTLNAPYLMRIGVGTITKTIIEGTPSINLVQITGYSGYDVFGTTQIENVSFKTAAVALDVQNFENIKVTECNFQNISNYNLKNTSNKNINARNNYWGTTDENTIKTKILDLFDNINYGEVDYGAFSVNPFVTNPLPVPTSVFKGLHVDGTYLKWNRVNNAAVSGYNIYKKSNEAYVFLADAGSNDHFVTTESHDNAFVVTAHSAEADGINDQLDGTESGYSTEGAYFFTSGAAPIAACEGASVGLSFSSAYPFLSSSSYNLRVSTSPSFANSATAFSATIGEGTDILWQLPDTITATKKIYYRIEFNDIPIIGQGQSITVNPNPEVSFTIESLPCSPLSRKVLLVKKTESALVEWWSDDASLNMTGAETSSIIASWDNAGTKNLKLKATANGCVYALTKTVELVKPAPLPVPAICSIIFDEATRKNRLLWDYSDSRIKEFKVLRETSTANLFEVIATLPASQKNYVDDAGSSHTRSYRYQLIAKDDCGNETVASDPIRTLFLQISPTSDGWNLSWEERSEKGSLEVYRRQDSEWEKIGTVPSNNTLYTDANVERRSQFYQAKLITDNHCAITSNVVYNGISGVEQLKTLTVYPNPATNELRFESDQDAAYVIHDGHGFPTGKGSVAKGNNSISVKEFAPGIYVLRIKSNDGHQSVKFLKQ